MSAKVFSDVGTATRKFGDALPVTPYVRPADWPALPTLTASDQRFVGVHAVYPEDANFLALSASGAYTVDWGDGVTENFAAGVQAYHTYTFADADLSAVTSRGYKCAVVSLTMQSGQNLTALILNTKHDKPYLQPYSSGFLDIAIAGQYLTDLRIGVGRQGLSNQYIRFAALEQVNIVRSDLRTLEHLFYACSSLQSVMGVAISTLPASTFAVTFQDTEDTVTATSHGLRNGDPVMFPTVVTTTGLTQGITRYFVVGATTNTFQVSTNYGGAAVVLITDGSGTCRVGTSFANMFNSCNSLRSIPALNTAAGISFSNMFGNCNSLQTIPLLNTASGVDFSFMFWQCYSLQEIPLLNTAAGISFTSMFRFCSSLKTIPLLNTAAGTDFSSMFWQCFSLREMPLLNTAAGTSFANMFSNCASLQEIPLLNTAAGISFSSMFSACFSLQEIPLLNTAAGTSFNSMFNNCYSLQTIPLLNTASGTDFSSMFINCNSLQTIPLLNTAAGTNFTSMFSACYSLQTIPLLNTVAGINFSSMFINCSSLKTIPLLNTAAGTNFTSMFSNCISLETIPPLNTAAGLNFSNMFSVCNSLQSAPLTAVKTSLNVSACKLSEAALTTLINNCSYNIAAQTLTISSNWGAVAPLALSGTTTLGSTTVTMANTTGITTGMQVVGVGTSIGSNLAIAFTDAGDTVNLTAHGLSNGDEVSFPGITTTTGLISNTRYFVVGATANTFQVAATSGGAVLPLTNNGTGFLRYRTTVTAINPNVSVILSRPAVASGTSTLYFRTLRTDAIQIRNWTVIG